jgi:hypothetical protein
MKELLEVTLLNAVNKLECSNPELQGIILAIERILTIWLLHVSIKKIPVKCH